MNVNDVISSGLLESYVLGTASDAENTLIRELCKKHPELVTEIEAVEESLIRLSSRMSKPLNASLKQKISAELQFKEEPATAHSPEKIIPLHKPENSGSVKVYRFALAASLLLFVTSFIYNVLLQKELSKANGELAELSTSRSIMAEQLQIREASLNTVTEQFRVVSNPNIKTVGLKGMNYLAKNQAAVHWNVATDEIYFDASQLPLSPDAKQYQLWAIVAGKPVDLGVIDTTSDSGVFQKMRSVKGAQAFAVTIEKPGGSIAPTLGTMCLLGNV